VNESLPAASPRLIDRLTAPLERFLALEAASTILLLAATVVALAWANSPWAASYEHLLHVPLAAKIGPWELELSLHHFVNDALMGLFFFVVGLEIKREVVAGPLRDPRHAALPLAAALGGMAVPAAIYLVLIGGDPASRGWGIPMATDIAFVVGCLALLGSRVAPGFKVFLLSVAVVDDLGAILVIAVGYTSDLNATALLLAGAGLGVILLCRRLGVRQTGAYVVLGSGVWLAVHESGVHATVAGVVLGLLTPARPWIGAHGFASILAHAGTVWRGDTDVPGEPGRAVAARVKRAAREAVSPLVRLETTLHPWSAFVIMPLFALANAGVRLDVSLASDPVALAVTAGLVLGKPIGILAFSAAAVRLGVARLPDGVNWTVMLGGGLLAGIGFTMSLFIAGLALDGRALDAAKVGVIGASVVSALGGLTLLARVLPAARR
jgi:NhaA family Na+:H+ antiporter